MAESRAVSKLRDGQKAVYVAYPEVRRQLRPTVAERWAVEARSSQDQSVLEAVPTGGRFQERVGMDSVKVNMNPVRSEHLL